MVFVSVSQKLATWRGEKPIAYIGGSGGHALLFSLFNLSHPLSLLNLKGKLPTRKEISNDIW